MLSPNCTGKPNVEWWISSGVKMETSQLRPNPSSNSCAPLGYKLRILQHEGLCSCVFPRLLNAHRVVLPVSRVDLAAWTSVVIPSAVKSATPISRATLAPNVKASTH